MRRVLVSPGKKEHLILIGFRYLGGVRWEGGGVAFTRSLSLVILNCTNKKGFQDSEP